MSVWIVGCWLVVSSSYVSRKGLVILKDTVATLANLLRLSYEHDTGNLYHVQCRDSHLRFVDTIVTVRPYLLHVPQLYIVI